MACVMQSCKQIPSALAGVLRAGCPSFTSCRQLPLLPLLLLLLLLTLPQQW
jgi:hypothetical protein